MNHATAAAGPVTLENEFQTSQSENVNCVYNIFPALKDDPQKENTEMCMSLLSARQKKEKFFFEGRKRRGRSCARDPSPIKLVGEKSRTMLEEAGGSNQRRSNEIILFFQRKSRLLSCASPAALCRIPSFPI
jgi:hypothetical protein